MKVRLPLSLLFACAASVAAGIAAPAANAASASLTTTVTPSLVYTDPLVSKQWQWDPDKGGVNIAPVWNDGITGSGIVIGIVDEWVEPNHEDLNVSPYNPGTDLANGLSKDFVGSETIPTDDPETEEDESETQIYTDEDHGTFVAGMAAAVGGNDIGIVGAAPGATIAGLHVDLDDDTSVMSALWWGTGVSSSGGYTSEAAIQVKNCSWGSCFNETGSADIWDAIEKTSRNNVIYVFAAGNARGGDYLQPGSTGWSSEGNSPYVINVAATNTDGTYSSFSSYGSNVFISAPGADVVSTDRTGTYGYNSGSISSSSDETTSATGSIADPDYASSDGTSFSSPLVAGVIALGKEVCMPMDVRWAKHALAYSSGHDTAPNIDAKYDSDKGTYVQESGYTTTTTDDDGNTTTVTVNPTGEWYRNNGGYWFNNNYGFGLVDPEGFIDTVQAIAYTTVETTYSTTSVTQTSSSETGAEYSVSTASSSANSGLNQDIETVSVTLNFSSEFLANEDFDLDSLKVTLISPDGLESVLVQPSWDVSVPSSTVAGANGDEATSASWTFLSNAYWGASYADSDGDWTVKIEYDGVEDVDMSGWITVSSVEFTMGEMVFEGSTRGVDAGRTVNAHALVLDSSSFAVNGKFYVEDAVYVQGGNFTIGSSGEVGFYQNAELNKGAIYVQTGGTATIEGQASFSRGVHLYNGTFNLQSNSLSSGNGFYVYGGTLNVRASDSNPYVSAGATVTVTGGAVNLRSGVNFQSSIVLNGGALNAEQRSSGTTLSIYGANASATLATRTTFSGGISVGRTDTRTTTTTDEETGETSTSTETILYGGTLTLNGRVTTPTLSLAGAGSATLSVSGSDRASLSGSVSVTDSATFAIDGTQRDSTTGEEVGAEIKGMLSQTGGNVSWTGTLTTGGISVSGGGTLTGGSTLGVVSSARTATYDSEKISVDERNLALSVENGGIFRVTGTTTVASGEVVVSDGATLSFSSRSRDDYGVLVIGGNTAAATYTVVGEDGKPKPMQTDEKYYLAGLTFNSSGNEPITVNINYDYGTALPYSATLIRFEQDSSENSNAGENAASGLENVDFNVTVPNAPRILTVTDTGYEAEELKFAVTENGETGELVLGVDEAQASSTDFITGRLFYDWQSPEVTAVQVALLRNEAASADLLAALEDFVSITEVHAVYNGIGTPVNVIAIDELHDKQANAVTGALSRRSRELRSGFIHSDTWSNPLFGTSGFSFAARPNMVAATGFVPYLTAEEDYPLMIWMNGGYSFSEADDGAMTVSTKTNMLNFMMGADYGVSENLAVGVFAGYTSGRTKFDDHSRTEAQSRNVGVYLAGSASDSVGSLYFTAMASYGYEEYDFRRRLSVGGVNASADASPDGWQGIVFFEGGYEWKMKKFSMGPSFSLRYVANNLDGYTESSSAAWMRQEVEDVSYDSLQSSVGWRMAYRADFETVSLLPEVRISWNHEFLGRDEDFDARLALPNSDSYTNSIVNTGDDYATAGVGLTVMLGEVSTLSLDYDIQFLRDDADPTHSVNAMLRVRF